MMGPTARVVQCFRGSQTVALRRFCKSRRILTLTFDDGPGQRMTPAVLQRLEAAGARATFFLLGRSLMQNPSLVQRISEAGHEIGTHTHDHHHAWKVTPWRSLQDARRGMGHVAACSSGPRIFRPPYGKLTPLTWLFMIRHGYSFGWWTIDSHDTADNLPSVDDVMQRVHDHGGGVILMHDFDRAEASEKPREQFVLSLTEELLTLAKRSGMDVVPLNEVLMRMRTEMS